MSLEQGWKTYLLSTEQIWRVIPFVIRARMKDMPLINRALWKMIPLVIRACMNDIPLLNRAIMEDNTSCHQYKDERHASCQQRKYVMRFKICIIILSYWNLELFGVNEVSGTSHNTGTNVVIGTSHDIWTKIMSGTSHDSGTNVVSGTSHDTETNEVNGACDSLDKQGIMMWTFNLVPYC